MKSLTGAFFLVLTLAPTGAGQVDLPVWADPSVPREARVLSCAKCHQQTYANWKKGPHAQASFRLENYIQDVRTNPQYAKVEKDGVEDHTAKGKCIKCHETHNLFENELPVDWHGEKFSVLGKTGSRKDAKGLGVDCLSCHANGMRVVTRADYRPTPGLKRAPDFCDPLPSTMFSSVNTCLVCHALMRGQVYSWAKAHKNTGVQTCNSCHMEKDPAGKPTHYYFWARDLEEEYKRRPAEMMPFDRVKIEVVGSRGSRSLHVLWVNDFSPHDVIPSGPRQDIFKIEVMDNSNRVHFTQKIRFFQKEFLNEVPPEKNAVNVHLPAGGKYEERFRLPAGVTSTGKIRLGVFRKESFYLDDSRMRKVYEREIDYR